MRGSHAKGSRAGSSLQVRLKNRPPRGKVFGSDRKDGQKESLRSSFVESTDGGNALTYGVHTLTLHSKDTHVLHRFAEQLFMISIRS